MRSGLYWSAVTGQRLADALGPLFQELNIGFWKRFADLFATSELAKSWVDLLDATTGKRYDKRDPKKQPSFTYKMDLSRDMSGYEISPHTDTDAKWYSLHTTNTARTWPFFGTGIEVNLEEISHTLATLNKVRCQFCLE